mmetsp:Transcript_24186/g.47039  ORF Transcript_24186/g.47039 Transcript_24186/m.47039 type:complete len:95 (+) Transcript_24186:296-580(+)
MTRAMPAQSCNVKLTLRKAEDSKQFTTSDMLTAKVLRMLSAYFIVRETMNPPNAFNNTTRHVIPLQPENGPPSRNPRKSESIAAMATGKQKSCS